MTNRYRTVTSFVGLAILFSTAVAFAQQPHCIKANVPFDFRIGESLYPAGEYRVTFPLKSNYSVALLTNSEGKGLQLIAMRFGDRAVKTEQTYLLFRAYGQDYFLAQMSAAGLGPSLDIPTSPAERETIRNLAFKGDATTAKSVLIAAR